MQHSGKVGDDNAKGHTAGQEDLWGGNPLERVEQRRIKGETYRSQLATPVDEVVDETYGNWE